MTSKRPAGVEALITPLYLLALLLQATPLVDFVSSVLPLRLADVQWRFATVGLLSGFLLTPLLGVALAMGVAHVAGHLRVQRVMAIVNLALTGCFIVLLLGFLLDVVQLRSAVQPEAAAAFATESTKAVVKHLSFALVLGMLAWNGLRMSRLSRKAAPAAERRPATMLVG